MEKAKYSFWYEQAKKNTDVKAVTEHYIQNHEAVKDYPDYIQREEEAWNKLIQGLMNAGFDYMDIEDIIYKYGGMIQNVYLELGLKIGARLGAEYLL